jgi:tetratricopeptide (TPR) repeat protein
MWLTGIFSLALVVRLLHIWAMADAPFATVLMGDSRAYDQWATELAAGNWVGTDVFYQAPLYPYFLGAIYAIFGRDLTIVRLIQAVLGAGSAALLAAAAARVYSTRAGVIAGVMMALFAPAIFFAALVQKAALDVFLVCLAIWLIARIIEHPESRLDWLALGVSLAALALTRENALVLLAVALFAAGWRHAAAVLLGAALVLAPVALRNQMVGGGLFLTTSQFGPNFYIGNNERADGTYQALREGRGDAAFERHDATELAERALGRRASASEVSAYWRAMAFTYIASQPLDWAKLMGRKLLLLVSATEMLDTEAQESHAEWSPVLRVLQPVGHFGIVLPLAVLGVLVTWRDRRRLALLYFMAAAYAASVLVFFVVARYRYPLVPFVLMFAAAGIAGAKPFFAQASTNRRITAFAALAVAVLVAFWPVLSADVMRAITETNLGVALQAQGRPDEAIQHYRRAVEMQADYAPAYNNLGVALRDRGRLDEAIAVYRQALRYRPEDAGAHVNLATALLERGDAVAALAHFRAAGDAVPLTPGTRNNIGVALLRTGHTDDAIEQFRLSLAAQPDFDPALRGLGDALLRQGRRHEAIAQYRRRVEIDPREPAPRYDLGNLLLESGDVKGAEREFRELVALAPDAAQAHSRLGVALAAQERFDEAIAAFQRALALRPDYTDARRYLETAQEARKP